jgi:DNA repair protein RecN (Recombination protein N)
MLRRLSVTNLAVVADATLELGPGLNAVTGETGAGKSLILGAVELLTGERAAGGLVRAGADAARLEAVFEPRDPDSIDALLFEMGLPGLEEGTLVLRRELGADGRSRAFVGESLVRLASLKALGERLVDVHGQAEGHELLKASHQRALLDEAAGAIDVRERLRALLAEERRLGAAIAEAARAREAIARQRDFFEHQLREIDEARLREGEGEALREERRLYLAAERIVADATAVSAELRDGDGAALEHLGRASAALDRLAAMDARWTTPRQLVESAYIAAEEAARAVAGALGELDFSEERRDEVEQRLDLLTRLERKLARPVSEILVYAETLRDALAGDDEAARSTGAMERERSAVRREATAAADLLTAARTKAAELLARQVAAQLPELGMKGARFQVHLEAEEDPAGWYVRDGRPVRLGTEGADRVDFRLAANAGQELGSLARVASGGELSRVVLALKAALAASLPCDVMIFDEIDAGVGGRTARAVASRMAEIAVGRQVIAITHLAPVACVAEHHHRIEKQTSERAARVNVHRLDGRERIDEVARMLSGGEEDLAARAHAEELLAQMRAVLARASAGRGAGGRRETAETGARGARGGKRSS